MVIVNLFCLLYAFLFFCFFKTPLHRVGWPATTRDLRRGQQRGRHFVVTYQCASVNQRHFGGKR